MPVNIAAIANALNLSTRRIHQLKAEGLPTVGRGQYELGPCMAWYIRYLQAALEKRGPNTNPDTPDLLAEKTRLAKEQGDKLSLENAIKREQLVYAEDVARVWADHISSAKSKILVIPSKLGPQLVNIDNANVIAGKLRDELDAALAELAASDDEHLRISEISEEALEPAAETDDLGMGGSLSETV
jgi:phage terminase Nu1 subunit (DNA packaging protein)